ncbi:MAG: hypothetical protein H7Y03_01085 [Chitinophagaceae bacterium]|nr:hypothetical protein [Chitinophagaceae bacterium]
MKITLLVLFSLLSVVAGAQEEDPKALHETAKKYIQQSDYSNALLVLNKALEREPENSGLLKDQAFVYYLQRDYVKSTAVSQKLLDRKDADVQTYQIAAMPFKALDNTKELDRLYKKGLKQFPNSGVLYNEYGELLWGKEDYSAIRQWQKGIEVDPNLAGNYYNAAKYYYFTLDKVWSIIYGEIFVNVESYSRRTVEMKGILLNSYKKLFTDSDMKKNQNDKNPLVSAFLNTMSKQAAIISRGITPESLIMLRTRFILEWHSKSAAAFPHRLFEYQQQLIREGMYEAYNQWIFGAAQDLTAFQNWINTHQEEYNKFTSFQKGRVFKLLPNQFYNR